MDKSLLFFFCFFGSQYTMDSLNTVRTNAENYVPYLTPQLQL